MTDQPHPLHGRGRRAATATLLTLALVVTLLGALPATPAAAATATVGNGLTTTDLAAVGMSPAALASALVGPGVTVSNATFSGADAQAGLVHLVDPAVVSFNDGVILSSGNIADVVGPNKSDGITGDMAGPADADLNALIADTQTVYPMTFDAASLEFDFVPSASQIYFTYTFASDEYLEWVNLFNDVFAFYVNGQNCATVPNGDPVSIDTINDAVNPQLFRDNSYSSPPANPINIESDGLSVEMICSATVQAGQTNHMKLAIADTSDQILDSVVMIKAHTLGTTPPESCNDGVDNDDDDLVDDADDYCQATTTPAPPGESGIGSDNSAPPFTGNEGTPIPLDASSLGWTADPEALMTTWTVTGINGTPGACEVTPNTPQPVGIDGSIPVVHAICPNEGEYVARVDGWDAEAKSAFDDDVDFFVHNAPPAVTIDTPTNGSQVPVGDEITLSATVADPGMNDTVVCEIDWGDGVVEAGTLADGTCTGSHTYIDPGTPLLSVTATDDAADSSAAASMLEVVAADPVVTSNVNPSVKGQSVTFTASTSLGTTGTMKFYDGATLLASRTVSGGTASYTTAGLAFGTHPITVAYQATSTSDPAVSAPLDQQVDAAATTVTVTSTTNPAVVGQSLVVTATVKATAPGAGVPTGSVSFYDNGTLISTRQTLFGAAATYARPATAGTHSYTATYSGSTSYLGATSSPLALQVNPASTTVSLTSKPAPSVTGQNITLNATVKAQAPGSGTPTGSVAFYDNGILLGTRSLWYGASAVYARPATAGVHVYTATYLGSANYSGSTSAGHLHQVDPAATATTLVSSANPSVLGQQIVLTAKTAATPPGWGGVTGSVAFYDNGILLGTRSLWFSTAAISLQPTAGSHTYTATYLGSANFAASSTTTPVIQVVN